MNYFVLLLFTIGTFVLSHGTVSAEPSCQSLGEKLRKIYDNKARLKTNHHQQIQMVRDYWRAKSTQLKDLNCDVTKLNADVGRLDEIGRNWDKDWGKSYDLYVYYIAAAKGSACETKTKKMKRLLKMARAKRKEKGKFDIKYSDQIAQQVQKLDQDIRQISCNLNGQ